MPIRYNADGTADELDANEKVLQSWSPGTGTPVLLGDDGPDQPAPKKATASKATAKKAPAKKAASKKK
jgi:hypothetical protein